MKKNRLLALSGIMFLTAMLVLASFSLLGAKTTAADPLVVHVDDDASSEWYADPTHTDTISNGINLVAAGGRVLVHTGTYRENVDVNKQVRIEAWSTPIVDGTQSGDGFRITADNVSVSGFTIWNCSDDGIQISADNCTLTGNTIHNNSDDGVYLTSADNCTLTGNTIYNNSADGIHLSNSDDSTIAGNHIYGNGDDHWEMGIDVEGSDNCVITDNTIHDNYDEGVDLHQSSYCDINNNSIYNHTNPTGDGVNLHYHSHHCHVHYNDIYGNEDGIEITESNYTSIRHNNLFNNRHAGVTIAFTQVFHTDVTYNDIYGNKYGVDVYNQSTVEIHWNNIYDNTQYGVHHEVSNPPHPWVNATYNWWGHVTGPSHSPGEGDNISDYVLYTPWLDGPSPTGTPIVGAEVEYLNGTTTRTLEHWRTRGCQVTASSNCDNKITVTTYLGNPVGALPSGTFAVGEYFDVTADKPDCLNWINVTIFYTQTELDNAGISESELDGLRYWNGSAWDLYTDTGVHTADLTVSGIDYAGFVWANTTHMTPVVASGIDTSPPETSLTASDPSHTAGNVLYVTNHTVLGFDAATEGCPVNHTYYRVYNGTWSSWTTYTAGFSLDEVGTYYIQFYSVDECGNNESGVNWQTVNNRTVIVDMARPNMDAGYRHVGTPRYNDPGEWYTTDATNIWLAPEDGDAGVKWLNYTVERKLNPSDSYALVTSGHVRDNGLNDNDTRWGHINVSLNFSKECFHRLTVNVTDYLGHYNDTYSEVFHVDLTGPETDLYIDDTSTSVDASGGVYISPESTVILHGDDSNGPHNSGVKEVHYKLHNDQQNITVEEDAKEMSFSLGITGTNQLEYWSVDYLGNEGPHHHATFYVDATPPEINKTVGTPNVTVDKETYYVNTSTPITVTAEDKGCMGGAGLDMIEYNIWWDGAWSGWIPWPESGSIQFDEECTHYLKIRATDIVGNTIVDNETFYVDDSPPHVGKEYRNPFYEGNEREWGDVDGVDVGNVSHYINSTSTIWLNVTDEPGCAVGENWTEFKLWWYNTSSDSWERIDSTTGSGGFGTPVNDSTIPIRLSDYGHMEECLHYIAWFTEDKLGNNEWHRQCFMVDNTPPNATKEVSQPRYPDAGEKAVDQQQMNTTLSDRVNMDVEHDYQTFIPSQQYLDAINISLNCTGSTGEVYIHLYDTGGKFLAVTHHNPGNIDEQWEQFEFDDTIMLTPGRTYYFSVNTTADYNWSYALDNYSKGIGWMNGVDYDIWSGQSFDWAFQTEYFARDLYITTCTELWINASDEPSQPEGCTTDSYHIYFRRCQDGRWFPEPGTGCGVGNNFIRKDNENARLSFNGSGVWYLEYYVTDNLGNPTPVDNETFYVYAPENFIAEFDYEPKKNLTTADTITFTAVNTPSAPGTVVNYTWEFGDGTKDYGREVTHRYKDPSTSSYDVNLTVTAFDGIKASSSQALDVNTTSPGRNFDVDFYWEVVGDAEDTNPTTADTIKFIYDGNTSVDSVQWEFGDGSVSYQRDATHTYADDDTYTVRLTAQYNGVARWTEKNITIHNTPPVADFEHEEGDPNEEIAFTDTSTDSDGSVVAWEWEFGDGSTSTAANPIHIYPSPGVYTVNLTVTDDDGDSDPSLSTISKPIYVNVTRPEPQFSYAPHCIKTTDTVKFNASASLGGYPGSNTGNRADITSWDWTFGDGNTSNGEVVHHQYTHPGTYNVTLTVEDTYGGMNTTTMQVTVYGEIAHTFTFAMETWNLITYPFNNSAEATAGDLMDDYPAIQGIGRYNSSKEMFEYCLRNGSGGYNGNFVMKPGVGYFVYVDQAVTITMTGFPQFCVNVSLNTGSGGVQKWNFIGWFKGYNDKESSGDNPGGNITARHLMENITNNPALGTCYVVAKWDAAAQTYIKWTYGGVLPSDEDFWIERGDGLAVWIQSGSHWRACQCP